MERRKLIALVGDEVANAILLPDEDPTETAEQSRLQQLELLLIAGQGAAVPISPRDNDVVHLQVLMPAMEATAISATKDPNADAILHAEMAHAEQHYKSAIQKGTSKEALAQVNAVLTKLRPAMAKLDQLAQQQKQLAAQAQGVPAPAQPAGIPAQPPTHAFQITWGFRNFKIYFYDYFSDKSSRMGQRRCYYSQRIFINKNWKQASRNCCFQLPSF